MLTFHFANTIRSFCFSPNCIHGLAVGLCIRVTAQCRWLTSLRHFVAFCDIVSCWVHNLSHSQTYAHISIWVGVGNKGRSREGTLGASSTPFMETRRGRRRRTDQREQKQMGVQLLEFIGCSGEGETRTEDCRWLECTFPRCCSLPLVYFCSVLATFTS